MPLPRPTLAELNSRAQSDIQSAIDESTPALPRSILGALGRALARAVNALYGYTLSWAKQLHPYTADEAPYVDSWASIWLGPNPRKVPTTASGNLVVTGQASSPVPANSMLQDGLGNQYFTAADATIGGGGSVTVAVTASAAGSAFNQAAGVTLDFVNPPIGADAAATVATGGITGGNDQESSPALKARYLQRIQNPPHGGNQADYVQWALSVGGITRAWCFPTYSGAGTVRVYIANDGYAGANLASAGDVTNVTAFIESVRPVGAVITSGMSVVSGVSVVAPTITAVNFTISGLTAAEQAAVTPALKALFVRQAVPEGTILRQDMLLVVAETIGRGGFTLSAPSTDQTAAAGYILGPGTFTYP